MIGVEWVYGFAVYHEQDEGMLPGGETIILSIHVAGAEYQKDCASQGRSDLHARSLAWNHLSDYCVEQWFSLRPGAADLWCVPLFDDTEAGK